jgi:hypothetical protein
MLAVGIGAILQIVIKAAMRIVLLLGGAYALTTYVKLSGFVDALVWIGAGGYSLLYGLGIFTLLAALVAAGSSTTTITRRGR